MKNLFKSIALLLVFTFVLCSCQNSSPEIIPEYSTSSSDKDFDGLKINWGIEGTDDKKLGYISSTVFADMAAQRVKDVETSLNCEINLILESSGWDVNSKLSASIMSGSQVYDLVRCGSYNLAPNARAGHLIGLSGLLDVQNTEKWGTRRMLQSMIWKDDVYAVLPYAWPDLLYTCFGHAVGVNENYIAQLGQTDPREYVESDTWNWDKFEEVLAAYTFDVNGTTVYALSSHEPYLVQMMMLSNGCPMSVYEDGNVVMGAHTEAGKVALERARSIFRETCSDYIHPDRGTDYSHIVKGDVVMGVAWSAEFFNSYVYEMDNLGVLPFPQGPNATPGVYLTYHDSMPFSTGITVNANDIEATAIILSELYEPFEGYETKEDIINYLSSQVFFDRRDAVLFLNMVENTEYGFFREGARKVLDTAIGSNESITSIIESFESANEVLSQDILEPHYAGMIAVYGE
ncbi:MAG: extracellular solute-binding protein [Clostridia bacterium]|nr:extracellular solute-binding protein [Clostridia bacterium]